jgi:hypothetical protein
MQLPTIRSAFRKTALALVTGTILAAGAVHAQSVGVMTQDLKSELEEHAQTVKQIDQYIKQGQQYTTQLQQYEQMLTKVENLGTNFQLLPNSMSRIEDPDPLIQANCNSGSSGSIVGNLLNNVTSLINQSIAKSQQQICAQIVTTQVNKYNATVDMVGVLFANTSSLKTLSDVTSKFTNAGESSAATTQAAGYSNEMATRMNEWAATVKADDAIISSLRDMQSTMARAAMNAKPSLGGEAVQAAVLTAAFTYHPSL